MCDSAAVDASTDGGFRELTPAISSGAVSSDAVSSDAVSSDAVSSDAARGDGLDGIELQTVALAAAPAAIEVVGASAAAEYAACEHAACVFAFRYLLVFVAFFKTVAHGANDTANSTAALSAIYASYREGLYACGHSETPWWLMSLAGLCVAAGVNLMGHRVISTIGSGLTQIDFHKGFSIELSTAFTVILATVWGLPVSSTHCQVGAVVCVGVASSGAKGVDWLTTFKVVVSWVLTLPAAGIVAATLTAVLQAAVTV